MKPNQIIRDEELHAQTWAHLSHRLLEEVNDSCPICKEDQLIAVDEEPVIIENPTIEDIQSCKPDEDKI